MSSGSKIVPVRINDELLSAIEKAIESANENAKEQPYTVGSWIRKCIEEKLSHLKRSKKKRAANEYRCVICGDNFLATSFVEELYKGTVELTTQCRACRKADSAKDFPP